MRAILTALFGAVLACSLAACSGGEPLEVDADALQGTAAVQPGSAPQPLEIVETGWSVDDEGHVTYAAVIRNPNEGWRSEDPRVSVLLKDENGRVIEDFGESPSVVGPSQQTVVGGYIGDDRGPVADVEFSIEASGRWVTGERRFDNLFTVSSVERGPMPEGYGDGEAFYGTVTRDHYAWESGGTQGAIITVVARDAQGAIVGGASTYQNDLPLHEAVPFIADCFIPVDGPISYQAYARPIGYVAG